jgi:hypothetical protein
MKISSILHLLIGRTGLADIPDTAWTDDPYAHPAIDVMNERERADLPPTHMPAGHATARGVRSHVAQAGHAACA